MKHLARVLLTLYAVLAGVGGCSEPMRPEAVPTPPSPPPVPVNTAPIAFAGQDVMVPLPVTFGRLRGYASDKESNIERYLWRKISGPSSYSIQSPESLTTKLADLEPGTYEFELTVTDKGGLTATDIVSVIVYEPRTPGANELVFINLQWECPMGCSLLLENFDSYVAAGVPIRVFLKRIENNGSVVWIEAKSASEAGEDDEYLYGVLENTLTIQTNDASGWVDVRITFQG